MYKRKGSTKKGRKSPYKRRSKDGIVRAPRSIPLAAWNVPFRTTLKYSDVALLATSVGTGFTTYVLRPFSLFDIDLTGTGHQPLRFDQLAAMFQQYRVRGCTGRFNFSVGDVVTTTSALGPWRVTVTPSKTNSTLPGTGTDYNTAAEMEGASTGVMTTQTPVTLYQSASWTDLGINNIEELNADTGTFSPVGIFWIISVYNQGNVAATNTLVNFDITLDCEFSNPRTIATS